MLRNIYHLNFLINHIFLIIVKNNPFQINLLKYNLNFNKIITIKFLKIQQNNIINNHFLNFNNKITVLLMTRQASQISQENMNTVNTQESIEKNHLNMTQLLFRVEDQEDQIALLIINITLEGQLRIINSIKISKFQKNS